MLVASVKSRACNPRTGARLQKLVNNFNLFWGSGKRLCMSLGDESGGIVGCKNGITNLVFEYGGSISTTLYRTAMQCVQSGPYWANANAEMEAQGHTNLHMRPCIPVRWLPLPS